MTEKVDTDADGEVEEPTAIGSEHPCPASQTRADVGKEQRPATQPGNTLELRGVGVRVHRSRIRLQCSHRLQYQVEAALE